jgi:class 3 adenylate cyclase
MNASVLRFPFCDFVGSPGIASKLDAEDWRTWSTPNLDEMSKLVIGLVRHVLKRLGDGLMALFRYDAAQEKDAERTARHFDERGDNIERKKNSRRGFRSGQQALP